MEDVGVVWWIAGLLGVQTGLILSVLFYNQKRLDRIADRLSQVIGRMQVKEDVASSGGAALGE